MFWSQKSDCLPLLTYLLYPSFQKKLQELVDDARNKKQATFKVIFQQKHVQVESP